GRADRAVGAAPRGDRRGTGRRRGRLRAARRLAPARLPVDHDRAAGGTRADARRDDVRHGGVGSSLRSRRSRRRRGARAPRLAAGKLRLKTGPVDLWEVIAAAIVAVRPAAQAKGIRLKSILGGAPRRVWGDGGRLQQVVWNLLSNAIKFTPEGGGVEIRVGLADGRAQIVVSDTGRGIGPEFLPFGLD